jgi:hypothetical protein
VIITVVFVTVTYILLWLIKLFCRECGHLRITSVCNALQCIHCNHDFVSVVFISQSITNILAVIANSAWSTWAESSSQNYPLSSSSGHIRTYQDMMERMSMILVGEMAGADEDFGSEVGRMWLIFVQAQTPNPTVLLSMIHVSYMILKKPSSTIKRK